MEECAELIRLISSLARIDLDPSDCDSIASIRGFFSELRKARELVEEREPLYHVWEKESQLRLGEAYQHVRVEDLGIEVGDGYVKLPWRGGR